MNKEVESGRFSTLNFTALREWMRRALVADIVEILLDARTIGNDPYTLELELLDESAVENFKDDRDLYVRTLQEPYLREMVFVGAISKFKLKVRRKKNVRRVVALITLIPQQFDKWRLTEDSKYKSMDEFLAFHRKLAKRLKSSTAAIFYLQIYEWYQNERRDTEGYITKRRIDIQKATGLTLSEVVSSKNLLKREKWLKVWEGNRNGIRVNRFKPLRTITMSRMGADSLSIHSFLRSDEISSLDAISTAFKNLQKEHKRLVEQVNNITAWGLKRYADPITLELPIAERDSKLEKELEKKGTKNAKLQLKWMREWDTIISVERGEFAEYGGDLNRILKAYEECVKMYFRAEAYKKEAGRIQKKIRAFKRDKAIAAGSKKTKL